MSQQCVMCSWCLPCAITHGTSTSRLYVYLHLQCVGDSHEQKEGLLQKRNNTTKKGRTWKHCVWLHRLAILRRQRTSSWRRTAFACLCLLDANSTPENFRTRWWCTWKSSNMDGSRLRGTVIDSRRYCIFWTINLNFSLLFFLNLVHPWLSLIELALRVFFFASRLWNDLV